MRIWIALISALLLWTSVVAGGPANASATPCPPADSIAEVFESATHIDAGSEDAPGCPLKGTIHHHAACGFHAIAIPASEAAVEGEWSAVIEAARTPDSFIPGGRPTAELRPPIA